VLGDDGIGARLGEVTLLGVPPLRRLDLLLTLLAGDDMFISYSKTE